MPQKKPIHIGVLCDPASFHTQKWSEALQRNGAKVTVLSFSDQKIPGIDCVQIPPRFTRKGQLTYASFLFSGDRLKKTAVELGIDVLNPINITPYGVWADRSGFRPIASVAMGADILEYPPDPSQAPSALWTNAEAPDGKARLLNRLKYPFYRRLVQKALHASDLITGDNLVLVNAVRDWFGVEKEKVQLNRWGVEESLFQPTEAELAALRTKYDIKPGQTVVLSPRGMKPIYQGALILEAFIPLLSQFPDTKFIMFSAGYEVPRALKEKAQNLMARHPNFYYQEEVLPRREVIHLWSLVDLFISAPLYDGYSNAVAEGRFVGAIPVVNAIPGNREIIEHEKNGWIVQPFTAQNLAESLITLLNKLENYAEKFRQVNEMWIREHSMLDGNIQRFLAGCEKLRKLG